MERSVGIGFIFQCWNLEDFESITARERLTRLAARSVSISSAIRRIRTQSHLYSQADIVSKRWQLHAIFTRYNNFSGDRIRVHANPYSARRRRKVRLSSIRGLPGIGRVLIFQIHISLPRGNYPATAGRSSSFENSNFQSFIDISFSRSSIFSRKIVEHVRGIIEIGIWISQLFP